MRSRHYAKHTELFLVRVWKRETAEMADGDGRDSTIRGEAGAESESESESQWWGRVQRVVDGAAHEFHDWGMLVDTLRAMLDATSPGPASATPVVPRPDPSNDTNTQGG